MPVQNCRNKSTKDNNKNKSKMLGKKKLFLPSGEFSMIWCDVTLNPLSFFFFYFVLSICLLCCCFVNNLPQGGCWMWIRPLHGPSRSPFYQAERTEEKKKTEEKKTGRTGKGEEKSRQLGERCETSINRPAALLPSSSSWPILCNPAIKHGVCAVTCGRRRSFKAAARSN